MSTFWTFHINNCVSTWNGATTSSTVCNETQSCPWPLTSPETLWLHLPPAYCCCYGVFPEVTHDNHKHVRKVQCKNGRVAFSSSRFQAPDAATGEHTALHLIAATGLSCWEALPSWVAMCQLYPIPTYLSLSVWLRQPHLPQHLRPLLHHEGPFVGVRADVTVMLWKQSEHSGRQSSLH